MGVYFWCECVPRTPRAGPDMIPAPAPIVVNVHSSVPDHTRPHDDWASCLRHYISPHTSRRSTSPSTPFTDSPRGPTCSSARCRLPNVTTVAVYRIRTVPARCHLSTAPFAAQLPAGEESHPRARASIKLGSSLTRGTSSNTWSSLEECGEVLIQLRHRVCRRLSLIPIGSDAVLGEACGGGHAARMARQTNTHRSG